MNHSLLYTHVIDILIALTHLINLQKFFSFGRGELILYLFVITAKRYFPGDHIVQNGEALKHFETRF